MRIIGGLYRGKKLLSPRSANIRPTADQSRESVFNILYSKLEHPWHELSIADIFTGSGAFALEAISRGVRHATLVDIDITDAARNAALFTNETTKIKFIKADASRLPTAATEFDIIFIDAPYNKKLSEPALLSLHNRGWLSKNTICVVELSRGENINIPSAFETIDERAYGISRFIFLKQKSI